MMNSTARSHREMQPHIVNIRSTASLNAYTQQTISSDFQAISHRPYGNWLGSCRWLYRPFANL